MYKFDSKAVEFKILNDCMKYNVSDFSWSLLQDHNLYNIAVEDNSIVSLKQDPKTGELTFSEAKNQNPVSFDFDVDREGGFMGMANIEGVSDKVYKALGVDHKS